VEKELRQSDKKIHSRTLTAIGVAIPVWNSSDSSDMDWRSRWPYPIINVFPYGRVRGGRFFFMSSQEILAAVRDLVSSSSSLKSSLAATVELLHQQRPHYHWVGIYLLEGETLILGPYVGKPTSHTRIPLNQGICGAAASTGQTLIVEDVNADSRYLACSLETRSEIVVPIRHQGRVLGEIDIDSDQLAAFTREDQQLLEAIASLLAEKVGLDSELQEFMPLL
jgi:L-methionine (R)-S-oxide reductase